MKLYNCRNLNHVTNGIVNLPPSNATDQLFRRMYKWLGTKCGFYPQIWLSSKIEQTGWIIHYNISDEIGKQMLRDRLNFYSSSDVLFKFDSSCIKDLFPVNYEYWEIFMMFQDWKERVLTDKKMLRLCKHHISEIDSDEECAADNSSFANKCRRLKELIENNAKDFLHKTIFTHKDQFVTQSLDLSKAEKIYYSCAGAKGRLLLLGFDEKILEYRQRLFKY